MTLPLEPQPRFSAAATGWQAGFAAALLDADAEVPAGLRAWNGSNPAARFAVYRNNVVVSLTRALADTFPVVQQLVGEEFFAAMARCHIAAHPPRSPVLVEWGDDFAPWLERFEPAAGLPYLAGLARLERARVCATHATTAAALSPQQIADRLAPWLATPKSDTLLGASVLELHPSLAVCTAKHGVVSLWAAHQGHGRIEDVVLDEPESALVLRQGDGPGNERGDDPRAFEVAVLPIGAAAATFVQQLQDGATLAAASAAAQQIDPLFEPDPTLALLMARGAIVDWRISGQLSSGDLASGDPARGDPA